MQTKSKRLVFGAGTVAGTVLGLFGVAKVLSATADRAAHNTGEAKTFVILGASFAGKCAATTLAKLIGGSNGHKIILIDQNNFLLFTPLLTELAGGQVNERDVISPLRGLSDSIEFVQGKVDAIDLTTKTIHLTTGAGEDGIPERSTSIHGDQIVIALGSETNYFKLPGVREHSLAVKSVGDASSIRDRALALLERASSEPDAEMRRALLTLVVGGGGFSGVETMAAVNNLLRDEIARFPQLRNETVRSILIHTEKRILPELTEKISSYAHQELASHGVEIKLDTEIAEAGDGFVQIKGGERIPTYLFIWAGGVAASEVIETLDVKRGKRGGIAVDECCSVPAHPGIWAIGDCADVPKPDGNGVYGPTAQNATRQGTLVAHNIIASLSGRPPQPFHYKPMGELAIVGKQSGVARIGGLNLTGIVAWALWRGVYLSKIPGINKRIRILLDWMLDTIFGRDIASMPFKRSGEPQQ